MTTPYYITSDEALSKIRECTNPKTKETNYTKAKEFNDLIKLKYENDDLEFFKNIVDGTYKNELINLVVFNTMNRVDLLTDNLTVEIMNKSVIYYGDLVDYSNQLVTLKGNVRSSSNGVQNFKKMNTPSSKGTIREISEKYGISKKEVRRLKKEGKLESLLKNKDI